MWDIGDCCGWCKSKTGPVIDHVKRIIKCSDCGIDYSIEDAVDLAEIDTISFSDSNLSIVTNDPNSGPSDDFWSYDLGNLQNRTLDPSFVATTELKNSPSDDLSSDLGNSQNRGFNPVTIIKSEPSCDDFMSSNHGISQNRGFDSVSISSMSDRLFLPATVKNQANEIYKKLPVKSRGRKRNALLAACIYIACRQTDMTCSVKEVSSVANGANKVDIFKKIKFIAHTLHFKHSHLLHIRAADFTTRFCSMLGLDSQAVKAAQEAALSCTEYDIRKSPVSIAAGIIYFIARVSTKTKLLEDIAGVTRVSKKTLESTVKDLNPHLSKIIPKWFATVKDPKKLGTT